MKLYFYVLLFFQALRAYENRLLKTLQSVKEEHGSSVSESNYNADLYDTYSHLGHVHLLAVDYARGITSEFVFIYDL
jgi:hypothetical protein